MKDIDKMVKVILASIAISTLSVTAQASVDEELMEMMSAVNTELSANGVSYQLGVIEYYTAENEQGNTVFFKDVGNKQSEWDFAPSDPRRVPWSGISSYDDITWALDGSTQDKDAPGVEEPLTQVAISNAMATWQSVSCSTLPLTYTATGTTDIGLLEYLLSSGTSGFPFVVADVVHAGFGTILDEILPLPIIAATFTFIFDETSDIDNNGKVDVAFREIYYTNNYVWGVQSGIDIETVALHEAGHGLSQEHFGRLFKTDKNGKLHFSPQAVMNAGYTGIQRELTGTDIGGHCSLWDTWPYSVYE